MRVEVDQVEGFLEQLCTVPEFLMLRPIEECLHLRQNRELIAERARDMLAVYRKQRSQIPKEGPDASHKA